VLLFTVPRGPSPRPAVESAVVRLVPRRRRRCRRSRSGSSSACCEPASDIAQDVINANAVAAHPFPREALQAGLAALGLTERARAEEIPLEGFLRLARFLGS